MTTEQMLAILRYD